jgi:hypothetical protein
METNHFFGRLVEDERDILRLADRSSHDCDRSHCMLRSDGGDGVSATGIGGAGGRRHAEKIGRSRVAEQRRIVAELAGTF